MTASIIIPRPIGAARPPECLRVVLPEVQNEVATAVRRAQAPEGSDLHREALIHKHRTEVAAGSPLPFNEEDYKTDSWAVGAVANLAEKARAEQLKLSEAQQVLHDAEINASTLPQPHSKRWLRLVSFALLALAACAAFASARLVAPTLDAFALGGYLGSTYGSGAEVANYCFMIALLICSVVSVGQAVAVIALSGQLGVASKAGMFAADVLVAGSFYGLRAAAGSSAQSLGLVLLELSILVILSAVLMGAARVLRVDAERREAWSSASNHLAVLQSHVGRAQEQHNQTTERLSNQVAVFEDRETGVRRSQRVESMVGATVHESYLTTQAELIAGMLEAE